MSLVRVLMSMMQLASVCSSWLLLLWLLIIKIRCHPQLMLLLVLCDNSSNIVVVILRHQYICDVAGRVDEMVHCQN